MRTGAAAGHQGYFHEALYYASDDDLLAVVLPFLRGGVSAGEPTVVALGERTGALVRAALPAGTGVTFLPGEGVYARPASAIRAYRDLLAAFVAAGATQIRIVGDLAPVTFGATWDWWARYESAINHAYDDFPLWSMCAYDIRLTPPGVLTDVARTHPRTAALDGRHPRSDTYTDPVAYLSEDRAVPPDPLQATAPALELLAPLPVDARRAVRGLNDGRLDIDRVDDLVVAVSEVVTNALRHGRPPVVLRAWRGADRLVVTVSDGGSGPKDPFAGLLPAGNGSAGGRGLWISHQSCDHVTARRTPEAFTIRLTAGSPHFPV